MDPRSLVRPLEARWEAVLDAVLRPLARPAYSMKDVARLAPRIAELSAAYNEGRAQGTRTKLPLEARIAFSFPRDVPKGAAAVRELVASGVLRFPPARPLRVLDLGAGLGAMTWGLARALSASGATGKIDAVLVDEDATVLRAAEEIARAAHSGDESVTLSLTTRVGNIARVAFEREGGIADVADTPKAGGAPLRGIADVVLVGQVLSELDPNADSAVRVEQQAGILRHLLASAVAKDGALVVIEPALRERTRHLHRVRDRLLELEAGVSVFAPCLHSAKCPLLAAPGEWCHEDLAVDLPPFLVPLARAAGLRWQGLTFSYLVLRNVAPARPNDELRVSQPQPPPPQASPRVRFRAVSDLLRSKGKVELWTCSDEGVRSRIRHLDRDAGASRGVPFDSIQRGDIVTLTLDAEPTAPSAALAEPSAEPATTAPVDERGRLAAQVAIDVGTFGG